MSIELEWYGYLHTDGSRHLKRYMGDPLDITEAKESPFSQVVIGPFAADGMTAARAHFAKELKSWQETKKMFPKTMARIKKMQEEGLDD